MAARQQMSELLRGEQGGDALTPGLEAMAFVLLGAAINHSCMPNCVVQYGQRSGAEGSREEGSADGAKGPSAGVPMASTWHGWARASLLTLRDVAADEELTIAYVDGEAPLRERTAALQAMHGFTCVCERCHVQRAFRTAKRALRVASAAAEGASAAAKAAEDDAVSALSSLGLRALECGLYTDAESILRTVIAAGDGGTDKLGNVSSTRREWRGDAILRLGGALQRLHRFDAARATWLDGAASLPEHEALQKEAEAIRAYFPFATPPTKRGAARFVASSGTHGGPRNGAGGGAAALGNAPQRHHASNGLSIYVSAAPLLARSDCAEIIRLCEAHASAIGGWSTKRHTTVPTTDMEVRAVPRVLGIFNSACERALFPFLESVYGETALGATAGKLRISDAFVVRYDAHAQRSLPVHQDDSHISLTIALNSSSEYDGGGTSFVDLGEDKPLSPELGHVVAFPGALHHGGAPITRGVRLIIAAFLYVAGADDWAGNDE